ncbi:MAG: PAS domain-containing protein [Planctomycetes bacterium]|nr:PAS domain-containing protein [Planctomycetota bacterium]
MELLTQTGSTLNANQQDLLDYLGRFQSVLTELQESHARLESKAKRMEAELEVSNDSLEIQVAESERINQFLEAILSSLPTGVIVRDAGQRIVRTNLSARDILGMESAELMGQTAPLPLNAAKDSSDWIAYAAPCGTHRTLTLNASQVRDSQDNVLGTVEIIADQSALAEANRRMNQQSKMAALGTMAGGIAHEIRNPMNAVRGFAGLMNRPQASSSDQKRYAEKIELGVREVDAIISGLLSLANPEQLNLETIDASEVFEDALKIVQGQEDCSTCDFSTEYTSATFPGDRIQIRQALRNLIANGVQVQTGNASISLRSYVDGNDIVFEVHDAGPGVDAKTAERLTDPFYTTRAKGMGLGLSLVDSIARLHEGSFQLSQTPSYLGGANAILRFPLTLPRQAR